MKSLENLKPTPMVPIGEAMGFPKSDVRAVLEYTNPGGSHKDRPANQIITSAERSELLKPGMTVVEYTSGSMGISVATLCRGKYRTIICMPEDITKERERLITALGAELILTPADRDLTDDEKRQGITRRDIWLAKTRAVAEEIKQNNPDKTFLINQSDNNGNTTSFQELGHQILQQHPQPIDYFISCIGTGATWAGVTSVLKKHSPHTKIIGIDSVNSPSTHHALHELPFNPAINHHPHKIPGVGAGRVSTIAQYGLSLLDRRQGDDIVLVSDEEVHDMCRNLRQKGLFVGPTSGANALVSRKILQKNSRASIVTIFYDSGERYISTGIFD